MALNKTGLKNSIKTMLEELNAEKDQETGIEKFATNLSNAIDTFIKTATVSTTVTVTSVSGVTTGPGVSGPGAGTGAGSLS